jgi:hypothetical protein
VELLKAEELDATVSEYTADITTSQKAGMWLIFKIKLINSSKFGVDSF